GRWSTRPPAWWHPRAGAGSAESSRPRAAGQGLAKSIPVAVRLEVLSGVATEALDRFLAHEHRERTLRLAMDERADQQPLDHAQEHARQDQSSRHERRLRTSKKDRRAIFRTRSERMRVGGPVNREVHTRRERILNMASR